MADTGRVELLEGRLAELELQLEDQAWERLAGGSDREFSRGGLHEINDWARVMFLKNPLIRRGVRVQMLYVFGQGVEIRARDEAVNQVVQRFLDDARNQSVLMSHQARGEKECDLALFGNLFFVFFTNRATGRVRVRAINESEIEEIICNPEDSQEAWFYRRQWSSVGVDLASGARTTETRTAYYPDWRHRPRVRPATIGGQPVLWEQPVYHVAVNKLSDMLFGVSEVYAAIDWARAYKAFLEDWATLTRAYSRFAHKLTVPGGKGAIAAAKTKLATTLSSTSSETNPAPVMGSTFIAGAGVDLQPMRIGGANVSAEDGRRLLLMVSAATGLPESFFGDVSVGTLATAKSLDRPTELQMISRQTLWGDIYRAMLGFVIEQAVRAPGGGLTGEIVEEDDGTPVVTVFDENGEEVDTTVDVMFPPILEHDVDALIRATVSAATLDGRSLAGTIDGRTVSRLLLSALGVKDVDRLVAALWPEPSDGLDGSDGSGVSDGSGRSDGSDVSRGDREVAEAIRGMRAAVERFVTRLREAEGSWGADGAR